jgi:hypothetical protein
MPKQETHQICLRVFITNLVLFFAVVDKTDAGLGPDGTYLFECLEYTAADNDEISFVGDFAAFANNATETSDIVRVYYDDGSGGGYSLALTFTGLYIKYF